MPAYANASGRSNVRSYEEGDDWIEVTFRDGSAYVYTAASCGQAAVEHMKSLARSGIGLNSYINRVVKKNYASRR